MNRLNKYLRYGCLGLTLLLSSCFKDGLEECPPDNEYYSYIRFVYDYNMSFEDLFHKQVSKIDLFLFDEDGIYIEKLSDECVSGTFPKGYIMGLPEIYKEATQFVAFPGIYSEHGYASTLIPGSSTIRDLEIQLNPNSSNLTRTAFKPLWHGCLTQYRTRVEKNDTTTISLCKNTNSIRIVLQSLTENASFNINDFTFCVQSVNHSYDAYNDPTSLTPWSYYPFHIESSVTFSGGAVELHTLRLLEDRENKLTIRQISTGGTLLDVNLNTYIEALKLQEFSGLPLQEYMDREDEYKIVIFITQEPETKQWIATRISINDWVDRGQEGEF